jgi:hypothetical protein
MIHHGALGRYIVDIDVYSKVDQGNRIYLNTTIEGDFRLPYSSEDGLSRRK